MTWRLRLGIVALAAGMLLAAPASAQESVERQLEAIERRADERGAILGNANGGTVLYEFFDYNCPACRGAYADLNRLTREYPDLKVVLVEWPILGPDSNAAAHEALKHSGTAYVATYRAVMSRGGRANAERIATEARAAGGGGGELVAASAVTREIAENSALARRLGITGAPGFYMDGVVTSGLDASIIRRLCGYNGRGSCNSWIVLLQDATEERASGTGANVDRFLAMALTDARRLRNAEVYNELCWEGALLNAARAVMSACEAAVQAAPNNANFRDSRGLARALTGDHAGAITDFQAFITRNPRSTAGEQRRRAVALLSATTPPSNRELIELLRN